jgi:hypothetical protein
MTLILVLNNDDVKQVLNMEATMAALDAAYRELARQEAGVPAAHRYSDPVPRCQKNLAVGNDGRRLAVTVRPLADRAAAYSGSEFNCSIGSFAVSFFDFILRKHPSAVSQ